MPHPRRPSRIAVGAALAALVLGVAAWALTAPERERPRLGLLSTLPIYWAETEDVGEMLSGDAEVPWARSALEAEYRLVPLDVLAARTENGTTALGDLDLLLLAQPRALSGEENVALDDWVREGGHLLLFADPLLTAHSRFHIGDRRRPQDVVLLSPILRRWGLDLLFDEEQAEGERMVEMEGKDIPANLAGHFAILPTAPDAPASCQIEPDNLFADCAIGKGRALIVADAALFDSESGDGPAKAALKALTDRAFSSR